MSGDRPTPDTTLAILLGAEAWPDFKGLGASAAFRRSAQGFLDYLAGERGLGVPAVNVLNLFDDPQSPPDLLRTASRFLTARQDTLEGQGRPARDLIVYFVGHGGFVDPGKAYYLFPRYTTLGQLLSTGLAITHLGEVLRERAALLRRFLVIDACFSGSAVEGIQSSPGHLVRDQTLNALPGRGVALLCSSSRSDVSMAPAGETMTMFTGALLDALSRGDARLGESLSLRAVGDLTSERLRKKYQDAAVRPEVHSPDQRDGDIALLPLFPNAACARGSNPTEEETTTAVPGVRWCVVLSETEQRAEVPDALLRVAGEFHELAGPEIERLRGLPLAPRPEVFRAADIVASPAAWLAAVRAACTAELAFFDVTNYEPAVMMLLGVRATARRGLTLCSVGRHRGTALPEKPFYFKDVVVVRHCDPADEDEGDSHLIADAGGEYPETVFRDRVVAGLDDLLRSPHQYLDLPVFEAVRQLLPGAARARPIGYQEQALMLCPFGSAYRFGNWSVLRRRLKNALVTQSQRERRPTSRARPEPKLVRTLDMASPRLVSQALLQAIRWTDLCVIDWTGWRPSVFFEFGVRLAVNELDPVCIIEAGQRAALDASLGPEGSTDREATRLASLADQGRRLLSLFLVTEYRCPETGSDPSAPYREMVDRHLRFRKSAAVAVPSISPPEAGSVPAGGTFRAVWKSLDAAQEPALTPVSRLLTDAGHPLLIDEQLGQSPLIDSRNVALTRRAAESGRERLLAAWLYLHHRLGPARVRLEGLSDEYHSLGLQVVDLLGASSAPEDAAMASEVRRRLDEFGPRQAGGAS